MNCNEAQNRGGCVMPSNKREAEELLRQFGQGNIDMDPCLQYIQKKFGLGERVK